MNKKYVWETALETDVKQVSDATELKPSGDNSAPILSAQTAPTVLPESSNATPGDVVGADSSTTSASASAKVGHAAHVVAEKAQELGHAISVKAHEAAEAVKVFIEEHNRQATVPSTVEEFTADKPPSSTQNTINQIKESWRTGSADLKVAAKDAGVVISAGAQAAKDMFVAAANQAKDSTMILAHDMKESAQETIRTARSGVPTTNVDTAAPPCECTIKGDDGKFLANHDHSASGHSTWQQVKESTNIGVQDLKSSANAGLDAAKVGAHEVSALARATAIQAKDSLAITGHDIKELSQSAIHDARFGAGSARPGDTDFVECSTQNCQDKACRTHSSSFNNTWQQTKTSTGIAAEDFKGSASAGLDCAKSGAYQLGDLTKSSALQAKDSLAIGAHDLKQGFFSTSLNPPQQSTTAPLPPSLAEHSLLSPPAQATTNTSADTTAAATAPELLRADSLSAPHVSVPPARDTAVLGAPLPEKPAAAISL